MYRTFSPLINGLASGFAAGLCMRGDASPSIEQLCQQQKCPPFPLPLCRQRGVSIYALLCQKVGRSVKT